MVDRILAESETHIDEIAKMQNHFGGRADGI